MERVGNVFRFEKEGKLVAALDRDHVPLAERWPADCRQTADDGYTYIQLPDCEESCRLLSNIGLHEALAFSPLARDISLPKVEGRYEPMRHQLMTAAFIAMHERCYVLSEPRLGKTGSVILAMDWLQRNRKIQGGVLVITTYTTLRSVWARSIEDTLPNAVIECVHGPTREKSLLRPAEWYVTNYDSVRLSEGAFALAIREGRIGAIVVDELTHVGNPSSQRSKAISRICSMVKRVIGLTGSPADNVEAVFGMGLSVNPAKLPCRTMGAWRAMTMYQYGPQAWQCKPNSEAGRIINETLQPAIRYRKQDVFDLPPVTEQVRYCDLSTEQATAIRDLRIEALAMLKSGEAITASNGGVLLMRALQIAQGAIAVEGKTVLLDHHERTQVMLDAIEETSRKVVIFSPFVAGCATIAEELAKAGHSTAVITGAVSGRERDRILHAFQTETKPRILVCHPITVGFGTELSAADTMIFSVPLMLGGFVYNQSLERLSSVKQTSKNVNIIHVISSRMEQDVLDKLRKGHTYGQAVASFFELSSKNLLTF